MLGNGLVELPDLKHLGRPVPCAHDGFHVPMEASAKTKGGMNELEDPTITFNDSGTGKPKRDGIRTTSISWKRW